MKKLLVLMFSSLFLLGASHADEMKKSTAKTEMKKDDKKSTAHSESKVQEKKVGTKSEMKKTDKK